MEREDEGSLRASPVTQSEERLHVASRKTTAGTVHDASACERMHVVCETKRDASVGS